MNIPITPASYAPHGCDISEYQRSTQIPQDIGFAIVRATFGARKDLRAVQHVETLRRRENCRIGLYHFFTDFDDVDDQLTAFFEVIDACGIGTGDIVPHVDVEDTTGRGANPPRASWCGPLLDLHTQFVMQFGTAGFYCSRNDWSLLGRPPWLLEFPLWVPHWRRSPGPPATPGGVQPWCWQYAVQPWNPGRFMKPDSWEHPQAIDHDCVITDFPLLVAPDEVVVVGQPVQCDGHDCNLTDDDVRLMRRARALQLGLSDDDWRDMRAERDAAVREFDDG